MKFTPNYVESSLDDPRGWMIGVDLIRLKDGKEMTREEAEKACRILNILMHINEEELKSLISIAEGLVKTRGFKRIS